VQHLVLHRLPYLVDDVRLVASELATNAIVHARTVFTVALEGRRDSVLLSVRDGSPIAPLPSPGIPNPMSRSGRGLLLVNRMSQAWGVTDHGQAAKSVWASFELRPPVSF